MAVRGVRLFDATDMFPDYEGPLIAGIRTRVEPGDDVVVVGGGRGVSSVAAAHRTGSTGSVETRAFLDSPEEEARATLNDLSYEVRGVEVEDIGVYVLTAVERA